MGQTEQNLNSAGAPVPLFPLGTVLFPGGVLPLRIFEPRYLTMIGECMKNGSAFGVVLSAENPAAGEGSGFHAIGTLAQIEDFDQLEDGYLGISCRGTHRFSVLSHQVQDDQLVIADVAMMQTDEDAGQLPDNFEQMRDFVQSLCEREELQVWKKDLQPDWQSGDWLSCRLSELLPLSMESRQALLEMSCQDRLEQLSRVMRENKMI